MATTKVSRAAIVIAVVALASAPLAGCSAFAGTAHACASWVDYHGDPRKLAGDAALIVDAAIIDARVGGHGVQQYDFRVAAVAKGDAIAAGDSLRVFVPIDECAGGAPSEMRGLRPHEHVIAYLVHDDQFVFTKRAVWHALTPYDGITAYTSVDWRSAQRGV